MHESGHVRRVSPIGTTLAPTIIGSTYASIRFGGVFTVISLVLLVGVVVIVLLGVSAHGRSLEQLNRPGRTRAAG